MCIVQDALSRLGDLAVFSSCSFVVSNQTVTYEENEGKNSKGKSNIYCGI